jgi:DNA-binding CsgD family transcriptional regulator
MNGELIGRDAELSKIEAFLDRPVDGLRVIVLKGDPGIGKSTIWQAGVAAARERSFRVLTSRPAETEQTFPYVVLGDLFAGVETGALEELEAPRRRAFEAALLRTEADLPVDPRAIGVAIHTLLPILSRPAGLVLAIDDDQWMDASSRATLEFALRRANDQPILMLLARRIDGGPTRSFEDAIVAPDVEQLRVGALSVGAVQLLLRSRLDVTFPRPTLMRLHEASGGNPFFALELARARVRDPSHDLAAPLAVPPSLERLVAARLESLPPPTRWALLLIAAHGRMPVGLLRALDVPEDALETAATAQVIETAGGVISLAHPLLASAVYQGVSNQERRGAHGRLATALEDPVERGRHLALASEATSDSLASDLEAAAQLARDRGMALAAVDLAEHALRLTPAGSPSDRHRRAIALAHAHLDAGAGGRARAIADEVLSRAELGAQRAEALVLASELEDPGPALPLLQEALVEAAGIPALEAAIHADLAVVGRASKGRAWAEPHARDALLLAERLNDDSLRAKSLLTLAQGGFERGDPLALEEVERAHALVTSLAHPHRVSWADTAMGWVLTFSARYDQARQWLEQMLDYWRDRDEQERSQLLWLLALTEVWSGRWAVASEYAEQVREISIQYGEVPTDHLSPALIALHRGQVEVARGHSQRALALAKGHLLPQHMAVLGVCDLWSGSPDAALVHLMNADHTADVRGWDEPNMRWWRADLAEALLQLGRVDEAARLIADWESAAMRAAGGRAGAHVVRCRGLLAAARGDLAAAIELFQQAADRYAADGDPFNRGRALLALGVVRLRMRQKRLARSTLEAALETFDALGAAGWADTTRADLARVGGRERIGGLSPSELRVAELVADGHTNREIAAALFLGERTVASHLTHIYAKLGIRSRTDLARQLPARADASAQGQSKVPTS